jgi:hypothetical protein
VLLVEISEENITLCYSTKNETRGKVPRYFIWAEDSKLHIKILARTGPRGDPIETPWLSGQNICHQR